MKPLIPNPLRQNGSALIVGVIFLLVMTMLGLTAMQTTTLEERMSGNMRDRGLAFQAAEMALRAGDADALTSPTGNGVFDYLSSPAPDETTASNWKVAANVRAWNPGLSSLASASATFPNLSEEPQYWIEKRPNKSEGGTLEGAVAPTVEVYDITARSTGASGAATVILRSTVEN
ncbi:MAG: hypothetical protein KDE68_12695 [Rhodocyclaceae bacterium]|nr:hypothetical protein [Rhodocyclaceae bacterium]